MYLKNCTIFAKEELPINYNSLQDLVIRDLVPSEGEQVLEQAQKRNML